MVATKNKAMISVEEFDAIEDAMIERGYFAHEYVRPSRTVETGVICPICNRDLMLYLSGNSHQIKCNTNSCMDINVRGL
jgi:hypothetical protein